ncbi:MAG: SDR family NAD(P)-dependent oxidoreductase [Flavobacteriales bacterium]
MIIITSVSRGIGKYLFEYYLGKGENVIGFYNTTKPQTETSLIYKVDVSNPKSVADFVSNCKQKLEHITLINTAGISYNATAHKAKIEDWKNVLDVNLIGSFNVIQSVLPIMREGSFGRIINFSSVVAQKGIIGTSAYATSKSGLWGLAKSIAVENGSKNITINNINLGYFNIGMIEQVPENYLNTLINSIPAKRLGNPIEITNTIDYIMNTGYLNGVSIDLNGGLI